MKASWYFWSEVTIVLIVYFEAEKEIYLLNRLIKVEPSFRQQLRKVVNASYPMRSIHFKTVQKGSGIWLTKSVFEFSLLKTTRNKAEEQTEEEQRGNTFPQVLNLHIYEKLQATSAVGWDKLCSVEGLMAAFHQLETIIEGITYIVLVITG